MRAMQFQQGSFSPGLASRGVEWKKTMMMRPFSSLRPSQVCNAIVVRERLGHAEAVQGCHMSLSNRTLLSPFAPRLRKPLCSASPDSGVGSSEVDEVSGVEEKPSISSQAEDVHELTEVPTKQSHPPDVKRELVLLSIPAIVGQAIDPVAQLLETAYIGRLGSVELGSAGVSMSIFNIISKLFNIPLLSVATSFVAEDISKNALKDTASEERRLKDNNNGKPFAEVVERKQLSSVSTALLLAVGIGIFEGAALSFGSGIFLDLMGVPSVSEMRIPAQRFLSVRAIGAPAVVLSLTLQGIFRGFKDTKTPVLCLGIGNVAAIFMIPVLMYNFQLGVLGAAISTVVSQYIVTFLMMWHLSKRAVLLPPKMKALQFGGYLKSGGFVVGRTLAVLTTMTMGTSMAARQGPVSMAAHQICMQIWLAVSLLTDALATSAQAMIASYVSKGDYKTVKEITNFVLKIGLLTGVSLAVILGLSFGSLAPMFTKDAEVLRIIKTGILFVSATQPINALAFIYDGLHFGASDFPYAACSMMLVGAISTTFLWYAPGVIGLPGVWMGLTLFMGLRTTAGYLRLNSKTGPWWFLHMDKQKTKLADFRH